jgi:hypothetical protein
MSAIKNLDLNEYNMNVPENLVDLFSSMTIEDIQRMAKQLTEDDNLFEFVFKPAK